MPSGAHGALVDNNTSDRCLRSATLIIDCGANVGASVAWLSARYPEAHILAVEPAPEKNLFDGDTESIHRFPLIIFEPHDWLMPGQHTSQEFFRFHATSGREFCMKHENVGSIVPHSSLRTMAVGLEN